MPVTVFVAPGPLVTMATPTLSNARKPYHQLSSCFIDTVPDSLEGIYRSVDSFAKVSKFGGGMGLYFLTLSRMVLAVSDKIISAVKYMLGLFGRIVTTPFRLLWLVFRRPARKIGGFCEKQRKKLLQSVKLCVKIIIHRLHINRRMLRKK